MYWVRKDGNQRWVMLHEGAGERRAQEKQQPGSTERVGARMAHRLVREDFPHSTALYLDGDRIRRAASPE